MRCTSVRETEAYVSAFDILVFLPLVMRWKMEVVVAVNEKSAAQKATQATKVACWVSEFRRLLGNANPMYLKRGISVFRSMLADFPAHAIN